MTRNCYVCGKRCVEEPVHLALCEECAKEHPSKAEMMRRLFPYPATYRREREKL